jgi:pSer/pThr/pTyr-binding forkhead associated (FHA) protein
MLTVKELTALAGTLKPAGLRKQLGPFVLVQRPDDADRRPAGPEEPTNPWGEPEATTVALDSKVSDGTLAMLFQFDALAVATLPPLQGEDQLSVGRLADCDLVINDASVSKRHATLRWDDAKLRATVQDLGSKNGTFINAGKRITQETALKDEDIISFGEVQFWYLRTETLHAKLHPTESKVPRGI